MWWQTIKNFRDGVGQVDEGWMLDNINRQVGDRVTSLFWVDLWLEGKPLSKVFARLYELADNKLETVAHMHARGWGLNGEAWK